ncbi:hypothetical protein D3C87_996230 [compost metagenome]
MHEIQNTQSVFCIHICTKYKIHKAYFVYIYVYLSYTFYHVLFILKSTLKCQMNLLDAIPDDIKLNIIEYGGFINLSDIKNIIERIMMRNKHWSFNLFYDYVILLEVYQHKKYFEHIIHKKGTIYFNSNIERDGYLFMKQMIKSRVLSMSHEIQYSIKISNEDQQRVYRMYNPDAAFDPSYTLLDINKHEVLDISYLTKMTSTLKEFIVCMLQNELRNAIEETRFMESIPEGIIELFDITNDLKVKVTKRNFKSRYILIDDVLRKDEGSLVSITFDSFIDKETFTERIRNSRYLHSFMNVVCNSIKINGIDELLTVIGPDKTYNLHLGLYISRYKQFNEEKIQSKNYKTLQTCNIDMDHVFDIIQKYKYSLCPIGCIDI